MNSDSTNLFKGRFDLERVGVFGHSIGATVAVQVAKDDPRVRAAVFMDGPMMGDIQRRPSLPKPLMLILSEMPKDRKRPPGDKGRVTELNSLLRSGKAS